MVIETRDAYDRLLRSASKERDRFRAALEQIDVEDTCRCWHRRKSDTEDLGDWCSVCRAVAVLNSGGKS